jgi:hypothetical protein
MLFWKSDSFKTAPASAPPKEPRGRSGPIFRLLVDFILIAPLQQAPRGPRYRFEFEGTFNHCWNSKARGYVISLNFLEDFSPC